jgi:hypothetical protein
MLNGSPAHNFRDKFAAELWPPLARFVVAEARLGQWASHSPARRMLYEFLRFGIKQAWACLFGGIMIGLVLATRLYYPPAPR